MTGHRFLRDTRGVTAVEFALTAPAFLLLLFGIAQVAMGLWASYALQHGVEAAARCATITPSKCGTIAAIQQFAVDQSYAFNVPRSAFTVDMSATCGDRAGNQVTASMPQFEFLTKAKLGTYIVRAAACFPK